MLERCVLERKREKKKVSVVSQLVSPETCSAAADMHVGAVVEVTCATYRERDGLWRHFPCSPIRGIETCETSPSSTTVSMISPLLAPLHLPSWRPRSAASKTGGSGLCGGSRSSSSHRCMKLFSAGGRCRFRRSSEGSGSPARCLVPSLPRHHYRRWHCGRSFSGGDSMRRDPWFPPVAKLSGLRPTFVISALYIPHFADARFRCRGKPICMAGHFKLRCKEEIGGWQWR